MNLLAKLIRGDDCRKTRFHDEKGNRASLRRLAVNAPRAYVTGFNRLWRGVRPVLPWISYDAIRILRAHLTPASRVLEFGSGMSTIWFGQHAGFVQSVENCQEWHERVSSLLEEYQVRNVDYRLAVSKAAYTQVTSRVDQGFDLIMVDGDYRSDCIRSSAGWLRSGGILYLDNSDKDCGGEGGDLRMAEQLARAFARRHGATLDFLTDFAPTQFTPNQGLLIRLPSLGSAGLQAGDDGRPPLSSATRSPSSHGRPCRQRQPSDR
jgi:predicted O-methyltransferase YrrM